MFRVSFMSLESEGCRFAFEVAWPGVGEGDYLLPEALEYIGK